MENSQSGRTSRPLSAQLSPFKQHPIPLSLPASPSATQAIFLDHPSARISSSPASSPRIVDPLPLRRGSVHPAMSDTMEKGLQPGADFFDDDSSDSGWEDYEGDIMQTFSDAEGLGLRGVMYGAPGHNRRSARGRSRENSILTALPPFRQLPSQRSATGTTMIDEPRLMPAHEKRSERAREMSLRQLSKDSIRVVHNRSSAGTPRGSLRSNTSSTDAPFGALPRPFPDTSNELPRGENTQGRLRRNTSDSIIAGSIIDAHVMTMRALESLNDSPSGILTASNSRTFGPSSTVADFPKFSSFTNDRHITLSPLSTKRAARDRDRPAHLPSYFIRTPYPFTAKKEFPKPKSRPRQRVELEPPHIGGLSSLNRLDSGYDDTDSQKEYDESKGKHVLGLVPSKGNYDLRSRLERNEEAQGVIRSRADSAGDDRDSTVWLSLQNNRLRTHQADGKTHNLVKVIVPGSLTMNSPVTSRKEKCNAVTVDFDDKFFAERLREEYRTLAGNWFRSALSARKLKAIRLGRVHTWSGASYPPSRNGTSGLLAAGAGIDVDDDTRSPFTEHNLITLYHRPASGRARYTWVHWAQRVAASNDASSSSRYHRRARSLDNDPFQIPQLVEFSAANEVPEFITTVQFVRAFSALRIITALALMLVLSVAAALLWIFVGSPGTGVRSGVDRQRSDRVGSAVAIGILVLLLESMGFGAWVWCS